MTVPPLKQLLLRPIKATSPKHDLNLNHIRLEIRVVALIFFNLCQKKRKEICIVASHHEPCGCQIWPKWLCLALAHYVASPLSYIQTHNRFCFFLAYPLCQCSSLKCAYALQCEGLQNNHTSLRLSNFFATLHQINT